MKKQGRLILVIVLLLIVVIFSWLNVRNVTVSFGFTKVTMPLVILLVLAILIGAIIAASLSVSTIMSQKKKINELEKSLKANQTMRRTDASTTNEKISRGTKFVRAGGRNLD